MFQAIINRTQKSIDSVISKYVNRIVVAVPFVIAVGFATAAAAVKLSQEFGSVASCTIISAVFALVGFIASAVVSAAHPTNRAMPADAATQSTRSPPNDGDRTLDQEFLALSLRRVGPIAAPMFARAAFRNLPLMAVIMVFFYILFSPRQEDDAEITTTGSTAS